MKFAILVDKFETEDMKHFDRIVEKVRRTLEKSGSVEDCILRVFEHNDDLYFRFGDEEPELLSKEKLEKSKPKTNNAQTDKILKGLRKESRGKKRKKYFGLH